MVRGRDVQVLTSHCRALIGRRIRLGITALRFLAAIILTKQISKTISTHCLQLSKHRKCLTWDLHVFNRFKSKKYLH